MSTPIQTMTISGSLSHGELIGQFPREISEGIYEIQIKNFVVIASFRKNMIVSIETPLVTGPSYNIAVDRLQYGNNVLEVIRLNSNCVVLSSPTWYEINGPSERFSVYVRNCKDNNSLVNNGMKVTIQILFRRKK